MNENERIVYEFLRKIERTLAAFERLVGENAKLRELVADALLSTKDYVEKYGGPSNAFDASDWRIVHLKSRGRELGVEVDG